MSIADTQTTQDHVDRVLYGTLDPTVLLDDGKPLPAMTTMLYRVCDNDKKKFEEAARLVGLFIKAALSP
jgi:hypothetical protein